MPLPTDIHEPYIATIRPLSIDAGAAAAKEIPCAEFSIEQTLGRAFRGFPVNPLFGS